MVETIDERDTRRGYMGVRGTFDRSDDCVVEARCRSRYCDDMRFRSARRPSSREPLSGGYLESCLGNWAAMPSLSVSAITSAFWTMASYVCTSRLQ